jgi:CHAD domain-containing protein
MDDMTALRPGLAMGETLRGFARDVLAEALAAIDDPAKSDAAAVHDFRRAMKRWRALLRLLGPFLGEDGRCLRDEARNLARGLGGARDAQSALDALADLEKHDGLGLSPRSLATIRARLEAARDTAETTLDAGLRSRLRDALDRAGAAVDAWPVERLAFDDIADRLARSYRGARRAVPADWAAATSEELHELRKRVVTHRYQMDLVAPLWRRFSRMWTGECQRLRERLGQHQDLNLLAGLTALHQPLARWRSRLAPAIAERQAEHAAGAARGAARLFVEKPKALRQKLAAMWSVGR